MNDSRICVTLEDLVRVHSVSRQITLPPNQYFNRLLAGRHSTRFRGRGINFEEYRVYQAGDDTRYIDWAVTSRTGEPHIKSYSEEKERPVYVLVDQTSSMFFSSQSTMKSVVAAQAAAICGFSAIESHDRLGFVFVSDSNIELTKSQATRDSIYSALGSLVQHNQALYRSRDAVSESSTSIEQALQRFIELKLKGALVIIVSDFSNVSDDFESYVRWVGQHNDLLGVVVSDPMESNLLGEQALNLSDGELQLSLSSNHQKKLNLFNEHATHRIQEVEKLFLAKGLPTLQLDTSGDHVQQFIQQLMGRVYVK